MNNDFLSLTMENFGLKEMSPKEVSPLMLAYLGDAVYEIIMRTIVVSQGNRSMNAANHDNIKYVNAGFQARMAEILSEDFTEEELTQYRRGKNAKSATSAKNASLADYHKATGFEAVIGFLFLKGENDRIVQLCKTGIEKLR